MQAIHKPLRECSVAWEAFVYSRKWIIITFTSYCSFWSPFIQTRPTYAQHYTVLSVEYHYANFLLSRYVKVYNALQVTYWWVDVSNVEVSCCWIPCVMGASVVYVCLCKEIGCLGPAGSFHVPPMLLNVHKNTEFELPNEHMDGYPNLSEVGSPTHLWVCQECHPSLFCALVLFPPVAYKMVVIQSQSNSTEVWPHRKVHIS